MASLQAKVQELETKHDELRSAIETKEQEFGKKRAQFKEIFLQKESKVLEANTRFSGKTHLIIYCHCVTSICIVSSWCFSSKCNWDTVSIGFNSVNKRGISIFNNLNYLYMCVVI